ncbi:MAG: type II toxin-antitoxin system VapC family toxin [Nitrospirae bacterium]|nr:type II toxin-antitoxin system VapC family toxin [Nitrospirota bacterium]
MESIETVVLDTDILIDHLRGFTKAKIFLTLFDEKSIRGMISALTVMELLSGKSASEEIKRIKIEKLLSLFKTVDVTFAIAEKAGELRRKYSTNPIDSIIAATAISNNLKLVTCNINHYQIIEGLTIWKPYDK